MVNGFVFYIYVSALFTCYPSSFRFFMGEYVGRGHFVFLWCTDNSGRGLDTPWTCLYRRCLFDDRTDDCPSLYRSRRVFESPFLLTTLVKAQYDIYPQEENGCTYGSSDIFVSCFFSII